MVLESAGDLSETLTAVYIPTDSHTVSMVRLTIALPTSIAVLIAVGGGLWLYTDATDRGMETADIWAVGFFVAFFVLPIFGGVLVVLYYRQKRPPRKLDPTVAPHQ